MTQLYRVLVTTVLVVLFSTIPLAQTEAPTLTDVQRLQLQLLVREAELAQLRLQLTLKNLEVSGYVLDLNTLSYVKLAEAPKD